MAENRLASLAHGLRRVENMVLDLHMRSTADELRLLRQELRGFKDEAELVRRRGPVLETSLRAVERTFAEESVHKREESESGYGCDTLRGRFTHVMIATGGFLIFDRLADALVAAGKYQNEYADTMMAGGIVTMSCCLLCMGVKAVLDRKRDFEQARYEARCMVGGLVETSRAILEGTEKQADSALID